MIHPHLIYGLYLWGFNLKRLTILQKRAVRILARRPYLSHSTPLFKSLQVLKLEDLYITQLYKLYYKNVNNLLPSYFQSFTPQFNDGHHHDLRYNILRLPMTKREYYVQCTRYQFLKLIRETPLFLYRKNLFMKEKLNKKEQHKLYTLFTIYRSNIVGKTNQFKHNSLFINLFCLQYYLSQWSWSKIDTLLLRI